MTKFPSSWRRPGSIMMRVAALARLGWRQCKLWNSLPAGQWIPAFAGMTITFAVSACTVGPDYERPATPVPAAYKEGSQTGVNWQVARPADVSDRGQWWSVYHDPVLDALLVRGGVGLADFSRASRRVATFAGRNRHRASSNESAARFPTTIRSSRPALSPTPLRSAHASPPGRRRRSAVRASF